MTNTQLRTSQREVCMYVRKGHSGRHNKIICQHHNLSFQTQFYNKSCQQKTKIK